MFCGFLCLIRLKVITLQVYPIDMGHRSVGPFQHGVRFPEGNAPVQKKLKPSLHGMSTDFHDNKAALGNGLQLVGGQLDTLNHLQALVGVVLPRLTEPERTVRLPRALNRTSAVWLLGAKPLKIVSWRLS